MPQTKDWATEETRNLVYPLLDQFINGIPFEEFTSTFGINSSEKGWSLWTTAKSGVDLAMLGVKSQRIANTMAECLKAYKIDACVSQEEVGMRTFVTVLIIPDALPHQRVISRVNEALVKEYKRLALQTQIALNNETSEELQKNLTKLSV